MIKQKKFTAKIEYNDITTDINEFLKDGNIIFENLRIRISVVKKIKEGRDNQ